MIHLPAHPSTVANHLKLDTDKTVHQLVTQTL